MAEFRYEFDAVEHITAGAVGDPGQRTFYVQARQDNRLLSVKAEKEQVRALAQAIERLLDELAEKDPLASTSDDLIITSMDLEEPLHADFSVSQMGLGYDADRDMVVLVIQGAAQDTDDAEENEEMLARFSATRGQMRALSIHAGRVVEAGRPICGNCGRPMDPDGHFCPERNGHGPAHT